MSLRVPRWLAAFGLALLLPALTWAQPPVRLFSAGTSGTLDAQDDTIVLATGGLASLAVQTLDSYSGTWEVQCSLDGGTTYDTDDEVPLTLVGATTAASEATDTVGVWQATIAGCTHVRVYATAWSSGDVAMRLQAVSSGGGAGGGGGGSVSPATAALWGIHAEDSAHSSTQAGVQMLAVRQDSQVDFGADGDYVPLSINDAGELRVNFSGAAGGTSAADDADFADGTTAGTPIGGVAESAAPTTVTEGDFGWAAITLNRALKVALFGPDGSAALGVEDAAETAGGYLFMAGTVRRDTAATSAGTAGDNATLNTDALGRLWTTGSAVEDAAETAGGILNMAGAVRRDTAASSGGTDGDNVTLNTNSEGRLWVNAAPPTPAATVYNPVRITDGTNFISPATDVTEDAAETAGGTGPMIMTVRRDVAAASAGTTGDNATANTDALGQLWTRQLDPCSGVAKSYLPIDIVTATTTEITSALAGASTHYYICSIALVSAGANNVAIVDDDTDNCASVTSGVMGGTTAGEGFNLAANGGLTIGNGQGSIARTVGTNRVLCIVTSAAVQLSGTITVVAAP